MKKLLLILFLFPCLLFTKESNSLEVKLQPLGSDRYNISITENSNSNNLRKELKKVVNKTCGTRFEIESIKLNEINQNRYKKQILQQQLRIHQVEA